VVTDVVNIELTKELPANGVVGSSYRIEGSVKFFNTVGTPPFLYMKSQLKKWYQPEIVEDVKYERTWPTPITGKFSVDFTPEDEGDYEVTIISSPAPLTLPTVGAFPTVGESKIMEMTVGEEPSNEFRFAEVAIDGYTVQLGNHDADSNLLLQKQVSEYLEITPSFEWVGASKQATISIKVGYKDFLQGFTPKTSAYTRDISLPEAPVDPYEGSISEPIRIPLTNCGGLDDGAVEIVAKLPGMGDYITHIWNVYRTESPVEEAFRFSDITIDGHQVTLSDHDADSNLLLQKTTSDHLDILCGFQWVGTQRTAQISIKAGYKDFLGGFTAKTGAYTQTITLPEALETPYSGETQNPIKIPLIAAAGLDDGAIEVVLKVADFPDYITHIWDVYRTKEAEPEEVIDFDLTRPSATPSQVDPGDSLTISCPVVSRCTNTQTVTAKFYIYEGSVLPTHGTLLKTKSVSFSIAPNQSYDATISHTALAGSIDRRDVEVEIYVGGQLIEQNEWDDVFYVTVEGGNGGEPTTPPDADLRNVEFTITEGNYEIGQSVPFTLKYEYKGKSQSGQMLLSLGTGVYPTFSAKVNYAAMSVQFQEAMDWTLFTISGSFVLTSALEPGQTYSTRCKLEALSDYTQETDTDWGVITIVGGAVGIAFTITIWGIPDFGSYDYWACYYFDPGINDFVGDAVFHHSYDKISFSRVQPGGYLSIFLKKGSSISPQYNSPTFQAVNGGSYTYDVGLGKFY
jgi:hypothetical protein